MPRTMALLLLAAAIAAAGCGRAVGEAASAAPAAPGTEPDAGGNAARAAETAAPLKVCLVSASAEYKSDASLAEFQQYLESRCRAACTRVFGADQGDRLDHLEAIDSCDVLLVFARRVTLPDDQLERVKRYCAAGRPLIGVRTASHAFQNWLAFDKEVLGGDYQGHYGAGPPVQVTVVDRARGHPVLEGVGPLASPYSLYKNPAVAGDAEVLLTGAIPGHAEPVAWTRVHQGGRVFYTSLGGPDDFKKETFRRLLVNALFWTSKRPVAWRPESARDR